MFAPQIQSGQEARTGGRQRKGDRWADSCSVREREGIKEARETYQRSESVIAKSWAADARFMQVYEPRSDQSLLYVRYMQTRKLASKCAWVRDVLWLSNTTYYAATPLTYAHAHTQEAENTPVNHCAIPRIDTWSACSTHEWILKPTCPWASLTSWRVRSETHRKKTKGGTRDTETCRRHTSKRAVPDC